MGAAVPKGSGARNSQCPYIISYLGAPPRPTSREWRTGTDEHVFRNGHACGWGVGVGGWGVKLVVKGWGWGGWRVKVGGRGSGVKFGARDWGGRGWGVKLEAGG